MTTNRSDARALAAMDWDELEAAGLSAKMTLPSTAVPSRIMHNAPSFGCTPSGGALAFRSTDGMKATPAVCPVCREPLASGRRLKVHRRDKHPSRGRWEGHVNRTPEERRAIQAIRRLAHPRARDRSREREANRLRMAARVAADPDGMAMRHAHWLAIRKFGEIAPLDIWEAIWNGACFGCGQMPARGVDHIVPFVHGGRNIVGNLQPGCFPCNRLKGRTERRRG